MPKSNKKIRILYVITKSSWGGAQRYVYDIATSLDKEMFEVAVAVGGDGILIEKLNSAGIHTIPIPFLQRDISVIKEFLSLFVLFKIFKSERPDIIHLNSSKIGGLGAVAAFIAKLLTKDYKPKTIFTAHGWGFNDDRFYFTRVIIYFLQLLSVLFCDCVIAVSRAVFNQGMYFPFSKHKFFLIYNGVVPPRFLKQSQARRKLADLARLDSSARQALLNKTEAEASEFLWLGTIAELTQNKGLNYLIETASLLKASGRKFKVFILGGGENEQKLKSQITALDLENEVFIVGFVPDAAIYLKAFDIFILPSTTEALAYALIEAGLAGLPVVANHVGGLPEIVENQIGGILVKPKNPEALAEALKILIENPELRKKYGKVSKKKVSQKFSFEKMLKETETLYKKTTPV
ncbi:MAG: Glycosyltransferase, group 1 family [Candidatus Giovannonibacteria bacterium GW2011_GWC2_44_9]|uniref:Glycosyltransferase, group 1 family n=2 Tax=Candidatus Giovannoniibacteriota TaxID=1752738 RepID=A0A0G1IVC1_9BACT|nr:MAG: Glycosyltransferase, group 1 family [Candidatus Giovannonibacteria bacterium GW2011_GWA1_44_29]KKT83094.1 MAG: Glycosyltransferase, group 1 family [Candidatus Giovannonibacteria bacterium GW2011_GWC2_44_9]KKT90998.1 MAG: Glycosyltransferase, group 1 family [Parcubacteria group bacterium GW2011_GWC1_45_13]KKU29460.1 MAG: Glycosyltransferase, group 1 family [Candidatus Giovannonibacteria bacterium GW2011_GWB1_46_20]